MFKKILVCYDLSLASKEALKLSLRIAQNFNSQLIILDVLSFKYISSSNAESIQFEITHMIEEEINKDIQQLSAIKNENYKNLEVKIRYGKPVPLILKTIQEENPDLVVMGAHGQNSFKESLLGNVTEKILRHSTAPVLVNRKSFEWPPKRILVPLDLSEFTEETLQWVQVLSQHFSFQVDLLHVLELNEFYHPASISNVWLPLDPQFIENLEKENLAQIQKMAARYSLPSKAYVVSGSPVQEIVRFAKNNESPIILMPTHGRSGISRLFMGSVAEQVSRYAACSILSFSPQKTLAFRQKLLHEMEEEREIVEEELGVGD